MYVLSDFFAMLFNSRNILHLSYERRQDYMEKITYRQGMYSQEFAAYFFAVGFPAAVLVLSIVIVTRFGQFGQNLIAPMTAVMWGAGAVRDYSSIAQAEYHYGNTLDYHGVSVRNVWTAKSCTACFWNDQ